VHRHRLIGRCATLEGLTYLLRGRHLLTRIDAHIGSCGVAVQAVRQSPIEDLTGWTAGSPYLFKVLSIKQVSQAHRMKSPSYLALCYDPSPSARMKRAEESRSFWQLKSRNRNVSFGSVMILQYERVELDQKSYRCVYSTLQAASSGLPIEISLQDSSNTIVLTISTLAMA